MATIKEELKKLWIEASKRPELAAVARWQSLGHAIGVALAGSTRFLRAGLSSEEYSGMIRVEWQAMAGHDDDPMSITGNYLKATEDYRIVSREFPISGSPDWEKLLAEDSPLWKAIKQARL